ncbi:MULTISPECIES: hypothetical protein [unclassified Dysgonomonas]|uniref:hypothetical protein n=1 Tax=unclassified Dysgonomonas TaxID=2630389 RepID=UPI0025BBAD31|nr:MULTISPECIES: hypothetical protein [unclassified Dysgonomonas]HMM02003.1 hypothetical protein [Dysgonomonas sp.]
MASLKQFEKALLGKNVTVNRIRSTGKEVSVAFGSHMGQKYYWLASGICYAGSGTRCSRLDLNFDRNES